MSTNSCLVMVQKAAKSLGLLVNPKNYFTLAGKIN